MRATPSPQPSPFEGEGAPDTTRPAGEVVKVSTTVFIAQCHRLYEAPPLGSLVKCGRDSPIYGVVGEIKTQSLDPGRHPIAMGEAEETEEEVYMHNPQLSRLLSTEFQCVTVGHQVDGLLHRYVAPLPPKIHSFVYRCRDEEVRDFSGSLDFLSYLLASPAGPPDDMVASFLRQASLSHPEPETFLVEAGKELATLLGGQLQRLNGLLRRLTQ